MHPVSEMALNHHQEEFFSHASNNYVILSTTTAQPTMKTVTDVKRALAPAPATLNTTSNSDYQCGKKKVQSLQSASVARRNARERNRVKQVNNGFAALRSHIPNNILSNVLSHGGGNSTGRGMSKKLSKVETLRLAVQYIRSLQQLLQESESGEDSAHQIAKQEMPDCDGDFLSSPSHSYSSQSVLLKSSPPSNSSSPTPSQSSSYSANNLYLSENCENFQPHSPEDDELLDAIFSWQHHE
ncbi:achaete-scute complex protein T3-like [Agrilus planipennis]|uniref:Achaete-scute complex protein T3-like n=1 Tax=Agrilus planipennis TaxID=224129 RepID=A0A7F5RFH4_AGRPL|nr:achaete-scute complex protein T3-like [Agrilus planipennis]